MAQIIIDNIVQAVQNLIDHIVANLDEEDDILEELLTDDEDDADEELEQPLAGEEIGRRAVIAAVENVIENIAQFDDEDDFLLEDDREVLDGEFREIAVGRFRTMEDPQFAANFRMDKGTFHLLILEFGRHLDAMGRLHWVRTGLDVCLMMTLWVMGNLSSFRGIANQFGVSRSVVHWHYAVVIQALRELAGKYIKWPTAEQRLRMKEAIVRNSGFPGVVGMMDGTLIRITAPAIQRERYIDRYLKYSVNVLAVCTRNLVFTHVYVGETGGIHDSLVFQRSGLFDILLERPDYLAEDEHLLADGGYALTSKVIVPFRQNDRLTRQQRRFNNILSSIRACIERAFGLLKEKWRRLYRLHVKNVDYTMDHIMASFVLHNFVRLGGREPDGMPCVQQVNVNDPDARVENQEHPLLAQARRAGTAKRNAIAHRLLPEEN